MSKIIAVGSGRGGTGKTTAAAAISSCLASLGNRTLCLDFAFALGDLGFALGLDEEPFVDFSKLLSGDASITQACREHPGIPNLFFYSASTDCDLEEVDIAEEAPLFREVRGSFDYCIIDAPSVADCGYRLAHADADATIIVTTGDLPSMPDVERAASATLDSGVGDLRLLVNRCVTENNKWLGPAIDQVVDAVGAQLIGLIPEDVAVLMAPHEKVPLVLYPRRHAAVHFLDVARRITGEPVPLRMHLAHPSAHEQRAPHRPPVSRRPLVPHGQAVPRYPQVQYSPPVSRRPPAPLPAPEKEEAQKPEKQDADQPADQAEIQPVIQPETQPEIQPETPAADQPEIQPADQAAAPAADQPAALAADQPAAPAKPAAKPAAKPGGVLIASRANPELWAKSTLPPGENPDLQRLYVIRPGTYLSDETIRHRMWLHDVLDDNGIPYRIEIVGFWPTRKKFVETQCIFVEKHNMNRALMLIREYNDPRNMVVEAPDEATKDLRAADGMPQKICVSCGMKIDFDYRKCPLCKGPAGDGSALPR